MVGLPEILVLAVILFVIFGYRKLPALGRSAGRSLRIGGEKARELGDSASAKAGGKVDAERIGRSAGKGLREAREVKESFSGKGSKGGSGERPQPKRVPNEETSEPARKPSGGEASRQRSSEEAPASSERETSQGQSRRADSNR